MIMIKHNSFFLKLGFMKTELENVYLEEARFFSKSTKVKKHICSSNFALKYLPYWGGHNVEDWRGNVFTGGRGHTLWFLSGQYCLLVCFWSVGVLLVGCLRVLVVGVFLLGFFVFYWGWFFCCCFFFLFVQVFGGGVFWFVGCFFFFAWVLLYLSSFIVSGTQIAHVTQKPQSKN